MWPMLLDMSKIECKKSLRALELEAYASVVSAFRAQGDLSTKKIEILKDLQTEFKISIDRHKAELRRANNDEKLFTIAKRLSRGECITTEWNKQSKRLIPLLPRLEYESNTNLDYYRILADHIVSKSRPILNLYPEPILNDESVNEEETVNEKGNKTNSDKKAKKKKNNHNYLHSLEKNNDDDDNEIRPLDDEKNIVYLSNGYAVDAKNIAIQNMKPSEFVKKYETSINNTNEPTTNSLIQVLLKKYQNQQIEKENLIKQITQTNQLQQNIESSPNKNATYCNNNVKLESTLNFNQTNTSDQNKFTVEQAQLIKSESNNINPQIHTAQPINTIKNMTQNFDQQKPPQFLAVQQHQQQAQQISQSPPQNATNFQRTTLKVASTTAPMIKLTPATTPTNTNSQLISNMPTIVSTTATTPTIINPFPLTPTSTATTTNTIVKLTPTQINFNNITTACTLPKTNSIPQSLNNTKHLVVTKTPANHQKLIFLPNQTNNNNNDIILKQNGNNNINNNTNCKNGLINATPFIVTTNQNNTFMFNSNNSNNNLQNQAKSLKIISTASSNASTPQSNNKFVFNVANSTFKLTPTLITIDNSAIITATQTATALNGHNENNTNITDSSLKRKHSLSVSEDEKLLTKRINLINEANSLPKSPSQTPQNWFETNLQYVKDIINNLSENNENHSLKESCEKIKEKLENKGYERLEDFNLDIDPIKEKINTNKQLQQQQKLNDNNKFVIKLTDHENENRLLLESTNTSKNQNNDNSILIINTETLNSNSNNSITNNNNNNNENTSSNSSANIAIA